MLPNRPDETDKLPSYGRDRALWRLLCEELCQYASRDGDDAIVCEVSSGQPCAASAVFHLTMAIAEMGNARLEDRGKSVRYLRRDLTCLRT